MLDLDSKDLDEVCDILRRLVPGMRVLAFGSRVTGKARKFSDLDLVIMSEQRLMPEIMMALREAFSESDLPIKVDVLDWSALSESFQGVIGRTPTHTIQEAESVTPSS